MRIVFSILFLLFSFTLVLGQNQFIKTNSNQSFGTAIRISATNDLGWVIFSLDSLKLSKYSSCGMMEWNKQYKISNENNVLNDFVVTPQSEFVLLTRALSDSDYVPLVTKLDTMGNILWSREYDDTLFTEFAYTVSSDVNGNIFIFGNAAFKDHNANLNMICKLDGLGNVGWIKYYDQGGIWGKALATLDGGILARTGNCLIKTDSLGNVQWTTAFTFPIHSIPLPVEVSNGYIFTGNSNTGNFISFYKIDKQGRLVVNGCLKSNFIGTQPVIRKRPNGRIVCLFARKSGGINFPTLVEIDENLTVILQNSVNYFEDGISLQGLDLTITKNNLPLIAGVTDTTAHLFYAKMDSVFSTGCDTNILSLSFSLDSTSQSFINTSEMVSTMQVNDVNSTSVNFVDSQATICHVPLGISVGGDSVICSNQPSTLRKISNYIFDSYLWSDGRTTENISITDGGNYWLTASTGCGYRVTTDTITVRNENYISFDLGDDQLKCQNSSVVFNAPSCSDCKYLWNTGNTASEIEAFGYGQYWLNINNNGCVTSDTVNVEFAKCECHFYLPNTFTPNGDGVNDTFKPVYYCDIDDYEILIYNRWGEIIYESNDIQKGWNGKMINQNIETGVYVYRISFNALMRGIPYDRITKVGRVSVVY